MANRANGMVSHGMGKNSSRQTHMLPHFVHLCEVHMVDDFTTGRAHRNAGALIPSCILHEDAKSPKEAIAIRMDVDCCSGLITEFRGFDDSDLVALLLQSGTCCLLDRY